MCACPGTGTVDGLRDGLPALQWSLAWLRITLDVNSMACHMSIVARQAFRFKTVGPGELTPLNNMRALVSSLRKFGPKNQVAGAEGPSDIKY